MCGIVGIVGDSSEENIDRMLKLIAHRGPDETSKGRIGTHSFGVCRLAIVDIKGGKQPIWNEDKTIALICNGEIYNYSELRAMLKEQHEFRTNSDIEVILHLYEEKGISCFELLNGMFACAITDGSKLILIRDRMGEKPLYYSHAQNSFVFSSEIKQILELIQPELQVNEFLLAFETNPTGQTLFRNVFEVPPSHFLVLEHEQLTLTKYWQIRNFVIDNRSEKSLIEELRYLVTDAVRIRIPSSVAFTCSISGGLDSSVIAQIARPETVFSTIIKDGSQYDEEIYVETIAKHINASLKKVYLSPKDFCDYIVDVVWYLDQSTTTLAALPQFLLNKEARKENFKVILSGIGADEIFGGYARHLLLVAWRDFLNVPQLQNYQALLQLILGNKVNKTMSEMYESLVVRRKIKQTVNYVEKFFNHSDRLVAQMCHFDLEVTLPPLLMTEDRASSHVGMENRSPFLDHRLVEFAFSLPDSLKISRNDGTYTTKYLLRKAFEDVLPPMITWRLDKVGYPSPVSKWLNGELSPLYNELKKVVELDKSLSVIINSDENRGEFNRSPWQTVQFGLWKLIFFDKLIRENITSMLGNMMQD
jgi:asparagine synthase (glutamine-hydrolysing)